MTVASPGRSRIAAARRAATAHARRDSCVRRWGFACSWILALRASFYMPKAEYPAFPGARAARMMHLLQVYDTAQLRGYPRIVREYLVYSAFSLRHVRWGVGGIKVTPPPDFGCREAPRGLSSARKLLVLDRKLSIQVYFCRRVRLVPRISFSRR